MADWLESEFANTPKPNFSTTQQQPQPGSAPAANDNSMSGIINSIGSAAGGLSNLVGSIGNLFSGKSTSAGMPVPPGPSNGGYPDASAWDTKKILIVVVSVLGVITIAIFAFKYFGKKKGAA